MNPNEADSSSASPLRVVPHEDKKSSEYARTLLAEGESPTELINAQHSAILEEVARIEGQLQPVDALKLYEMAYHAAGPVLEIGCLYGKSTAILALAMTAARAGWPLVSVDVNPRHCSIAASNVEDLAAEARVRFVTGNSSQVVPRLELDFAFAFVDGNHRYPAVRGDLLAVDRRLLPGGFVLLHDYFDLRNEMPPEAPRYGVVRAAEDILPPRGYEFRGRFGCTALYQRAGTPLAGRRDL